MLTYQTKKLQIYFGDAADGISKQLHCVPINKKLVDIEPFKSVAQKIDVSRLSALNQTHGVQGTLITDSDISFNVDGDYQITNQINAGLGILTADCVPLILYDAKNHAIAAVHAGWRGAVAEIAIKAFEHMKALYNCDPRDMQLFIGPSAKACCYQVQEDFLQQIPADFIQKDGHWYFDTALFIVLQMQKAGIAPTSFNTEFNFCTICDHRFYSHRRQQALRSSLKSEVGGLHAGRQITIATLKEYVSTR